MFYGASLMQTPSNQPPALEHYNLWDNDTPLREAALRVVGADMGQRLAGVGQSIGQPTFFALGRSANRNPPELRRYGPDGERIDELEFHPSWHALMMQAADMRLHNGPWVDDEDSAVSRAVRFMLVAQVEAGVLCPMTMTYGAYPVLTQSLVTEGGVFDGWRTPLASGNYDPRDLPGSAKGGLLIGMGMTERQGGSDVRSNTTTATPDQLAGPGHMYRLNGHKWFYSVPQSDAHLVLAQTPGGLSCFLVPRRLPDGNRNDIYIERLKDKLGNRSNASAEVEFDDACGWLIGEEGRGGATILQVGGHTRFDCALGSLGMMRRAISIAMHHAQARYTFGKPLVEHDLMKRVLADLALEMEGLVALALDLAQAREPQASDAEQRWARLLTPAFKYVVCQRGIGFVAECMQVVGGNGYIEENDLPRLYREMPVNAIWEGSSNIMALDVRRALERDPELISLLQERLAPTCAANPVLARAWQALAAQLQNPAEADMRVLTERLIDIAAAATLTAHGPQLVATAWSAARLEQAGGLYGSRSLAGAQALLLQRVWPEDDHDH
ncbi:putative acyl-CoA dehydrogenase AidB [Amantichitinum ursilacus]|uniref:Putative acyl-CoA dehydrogenase AidB n=2 Tax=Amantichitinum ursilacus TaxID=857265 RepID=A0A0N0GNK3_9NEIS|nr:putative acyl-CoA dehydrogenase AidB [Amantichitinum ursilacus]